ncbi:DUF6531 domain-containing protein [Streptomyces carpaticus]|uniref:RHS repeat-associated core domain-containing protein n=1 Tax=Streptomyces carpaticus TaxID=285558 RepID=UPI002206F698|nr:DUF6531 domain-containing protein [Streptomyces carpaticus]
MGRASDWSPVDMESDPTPGDPDRVEELADKLLAFADDVADAQDKLRNLMGDGLLDTFVGETADAFGEQMEGVPPNLVKLNESHELAGQALATYWPKLRQAQQDADRALADAVEAQEELSSAQTWLETAASSLETAQEAAEPPDEGEVRAEVRRALTDAENDHGDAEAAVSSAQGRLDAAKLLAQQAKEAREEAASLCVSDLRTASEAGIRNKKWWEKAVDWIADNWDTIVQVAQIIGTIVGIAALFIGGPLIAGILLAVALVALADTLVAYSKGEASLWDVGFAVLDCIPGGRLVGAGASAARTGLRDTATTIRGQRPQIRQDGRRMDSRTVSDDPVDFSTGEVVLPAIDVRLPGILPLVLERHHISTYRSGRWFGRSWASTLDQRLTLDDYGVRLFTADGMILNYPIPLADPDHPVLPVEGPRWELSWTGDPAAGMTVKQPEAGRTFHFSQPQGKPGRDLLISSMTDLNGNRIEFSYDQDGRPTDVRHSGGYQVGVTTYEGRVTALRLLSDEARPLLMSYEYDEAGNLALIYNSTGLPLKLEYDGERRLTRWEDRNKTWYRYSYDTEGRCVRGTGSERALEFTYAYDTENRRTSCTSALGNTTVYQFNDDLQTVAVIDPLDNVTRQEFDRYDRLLSFTDALGNSTHYTYDDSGRLTAITRPDGLRAEAEYGEHGRPVRIVQPDGASWTYRYDERGNATEAVDPMGNLTRYTHDDRGAVSSVEDALGHRLRVHSDDVGLTLALTTPQGRCTRYERDAFGRVVRVVDPAGRENYTAWSAEGWPLRRWNSLGEQHSWEWDAEGNLLSHVDPQGATTRFAYGPFDLPISRTDAEGHHYAFQRDTELKLTAVVGPQQKSWTYAYDACGRLVQESDFDDRTVSYSRDAAGRITRQVNGEDQAITFTYTSTGRLIRKDVDGAGTTEYGHDGLGRIVHAHSADTTLDRSYDAAGHLISESVNGRVLSLEYDARGHVTRQLTPGGHTTRWSYGPDGTLDSLVTAGRTISFERDDAGREVLRDIGDHTRISQDWDPAGRLTSQRLSVSGPDGTPRSSLIRQYRYRADGHLGDVAGMDGNSHYVHDPMGRVTHVRAPGQDEHYEYDPVGNQLSAHWRAADEEATGERAYSGSRIVRAGRIRYAYDRAGRIVLRQLVRVSRKADTWRYSWNAEDQLTSVTTPDGTRWSYLYDPMGRRVAKRRHGPDGSVAEQWCFTWSGTVLTEQSAGDGTSFTWDHHGGEPVAQTERRGPADTDARFYAIVTDLIGTPTHLIDEQGETAWRRRSTLWGITSPDPGNSTDTPLRFPGQYADVETGWNYNYYRHYDPHTGRYTSPDPLGLGPSPNHFGYVHNPHTWADPLGLAGYRPLREGYSSQPGFRGDPYHPDVVNNRINDMREMYGIQPEGPRMIGANGTQTTSTTTWLRGPYRIDVENPNPGQRPGQLHFQDQSNKDAKYQYNFENGTFEGLPRSIEREVSGDRGFQNGIDKGLRYLGEN